MGLGRIPRDEIDASSYKKDGKDESKVFCDRKLAISPRTEVCLPGLLTEGKETARKKECSLAIPVQISDYGFSGGKGGPIIASAKASCHLTDAKTE